MTEISKIIDEEIKKLWRRFDYDPKFTVYTNEGESIPLDLIKKELVKSLKSRLEKAVLEKIADTEHRWLKRYETLEQKLADKDKELEELKRRGVAIKTKAGVLGMKLDEVEFDLKKLRSKIVRREKEHQDDLMELMAEGLKLCSCIYRERNLEWRKKIEHELNEQEKELKKDVVCVVNSGDYDKQIIKHLNDSIELTFNALKKELLDGSKKPPIKSRYETTALGKLVLDTVEKPPGKHEDIIPAMNDIYATDDKAWLEIRKDLDKVIKEIFGSGKKEVE